MNNQSLGRRSRLLWISSIGLVQPALAQTEPVSNATWTSDMNIPTGVQRVAVSHMDTVTKIFNMIVEGIVKYSFQVLAGIIILLAGWLIARFLARLVHRFLVKYAVDVTVAKFIVGTVKLAVMAMAGLIALGKFGIEIAPFIAGLSVIGFGTSFALQGPLSNYASGASLIFTKPFKVGDIIEVIGQMGEVEDITLPRTIIKTVDGTKIIIPNKHIIGEVIHNYSELKRVDINVSVSYTADLDQVINLIRSVVKKDPRVIGREQQKIGVSRFDDSGINISARLWCKQEDYWDTLFALHKSIFDEFKAHGIVIPFPQREVHIIESAKKKTA